MQRQVTPLPDPERPGHFLSRDKSLQRFKDNGSNQKELTDLSALPSEETSQAKLDWSAKDKDKRSKQASFCKRLSLLCSCVAFCHRLCDTGSNLSYSRTTNTFSTTQKQLQTMAQKTTKPKRRKETPVPIKSSNKKESAIPSYWNASLPRTEDVERFRTLSAPHVESFNYFLEQGLPAGIRNMEKVEFDFIDRSKDAEQEVDMKDLSSVRMWFEKVQIASPVRAAGTGRRSALRPRECRERRLIYGGEITGDFCYQFVDRRNGAENTSAVVRTSRSFGNMPIMVQSNKCHLAGLAPSELVKIHEESTEFGGYFIVNGIERVIRLLQIPRRNYATAIQRSNYKNRGTDYTDLGVAMRCAVPDYALAVTNTLHYLTTGSVTLKFMARKQEFLIPVVLILRCLMGSTADKAAGAAGFTDLDLYNRLVQGDDANTFLKARAGLLLQDARTRFPQLNTPEECLAHLGVRFRRIGIFSETLSDVAVGQYMIRNFVLIHLKDNYDKLQCLLFMVRKLYAFAAGECGVDNADSLQNQEILLPGHLLSAMVKEKFDEVLMALKANLNLMARKDISVMRARMKNNVFMGNQVDRAASKSSGGIGKKVSVFLATGNIISSSGLDLMQISGYTIVGERLNFLRYCAHFRAIHRGAFFMEMKTTAVRKLLPDQWGFLCPVHTPDGGPCGLLSHMALKCKVMSYPDVDKSKELDSLLVALGVTIGRQTYKHLPVVLDGRVVGGATVRDCRRIASHLRQFKVEERVPSTLEVALVTVGNSAAPFPGLYLFLGAARLVRPVLHRASGKEEMIGPLEQGFMDIACLEDDIREGVTTHRELDPMNMLSLIASLTPFSDQNQSPRNMYQCQMGKQTMGTPAHSLPYRSDNKLYKLQTPQAPLVQTNVHGTYKMDEYPNGTNAVVAVLSYTGFDMEDAMILNKSSYERGFAHASVYKTIVADLQEELKRAGAQESLEQSRLRFGNKVDRKGELYHKNLESDGFPRVGERIKEGDALYSVIDTVNDFSFAGKHKEREDAYVQSVRGLGGDDGKAVTNKTAITLRFPRNPVIGDKFSSRHGQKGVLSILWPQENMPFSESGISPDIIINPHAFPSRMTIGMLVESMAGKSGALHGMFQDATPFNFHESGDKVAIDHFGEQLQTAGYNYYGSEPLYSGVSGCLMQADLYIGVVYYQRLRHMVSDKYQVRATGPTNELTRQPIKGRKRGGGIRLGEMERDSLLSHGAAFLLQDRLLNCSDKHVAYVCTRCGDLLMSTTERNNIQTTGQSATDAISRPKLRLYCRSPACQATLPREGATDAAVEPIALPYVYRYLVNELAGMNIKLKMNIKQ